MPLAVIEAGCDDYSTHFPTVVSPSFPMGILCCRVCQSQMQGRGTDSPQSTRECTATAKERQTAAHGVTATRASPPLPKKKTALSVAAASAVSFAMHYG